MESGEEMKSGEEMEGEEMRRWKVGFDPLTSYGGSLFTITILYCIIAVKKDCRIRKKSTSLRCQHKKNVNINLSFYEKTPRISLLYFF